MAPLFVLLINSSFFMTNQPTPINDFGNRLRLDDLGLNQLSLMDYQKNKQPQSAWLAQSQKNNKPADDCLLFVHSQADYQHTYDAMFAQILKKINHKQHGTPLPDELWLVEHNDVYTLGQAGKYEHILYDNGTPIIKTDRGGQVTWHGTGQLVLYFLWDLNALGFGVRDLVSHSEQAIEDALNAYLPTTLTAKARKDAPGVYIYNQSGDMLGKIASLGFKIKHAHSYHGIAININNDLSVFGNINPCGYAGMTMLRLNDLSTVANDVFINTLLDNIHQRRQGLIALRT